MSESGMGTGVLRRVYLSLSELAFPLLVVREDVMRHGKKTRDLGVCMTNCKNILIWIFKRIKTTSTQRAPQRVKIITG